MAQKYTLVPLAQGPFIGIDPLARMAFGLIWDRYKVSSYNFIGAESESPWYDKTMDDVFCVYDQDELAREIGCSVRTVRRCLKDLNEAHLLYWRKATYKGACRYFVGYAAKAWLRRSTQDPAQA